MEPVKLTAYSHGGGCGCKISPSVLESILGTQRHQTQFASLLAGNEGNEDAAAWRLSEEQTLVSTTYFFMPIVNDPVDFGAIAAANALSDVYAMGAEPIFALALLAWPITKLDASIAAAVLEGAREICKQAGIPIAGGHTIENPEPVFGLAVNGLVKSQYLKRNNTAKAGDILFLTKSLGTGMITTAAKREKAEASHLAEAVAQMRKLNKEGAELAQLPGVHALTDVRGFGFAGHLTEVCRGSNLSARINRAVLPRLSGVNACLEAMIYPDMTMKNFNAFKAHLPEMDTETLLLMCDPQTSGGLLIAADPSCAEQVKAILAAHHSYCEIIGVLEPADALTIQFSS
ncbi:MAG: selenide, water dikinase SelD [Bacteroidia bacterium]|nr:selenide, water dikinase SelD [Bacteroidia bacterium]